MYLLLAGIFQAVPDAFESVWNFFYAGKLFMVFLLALSILSITVIIYKALDLRRRFVLPEEAVDAIENFGAGHDTGALISELRSSRSTVGRLGLVALTGDHADREGTSRAVEARAREEIVELESGVALLEVVITIAPLLGLLGTVSGLVNVFSNLGDSADNSAIAKGIAEALNTTIAGLAIAVPTVVAHSYFMKKIERMGVRMEIVLGGLLASIRRSGQREVVLIEPAPETATHEPSVEADSQPATEIYTAMSDAGELAYETPYLDDAPAPATPEPGIPRLLAGHREPRAATEFPQAEFDPTEPDDIPPT